MLCVGRWRSHAHLGGCGFMPSFSGSATPTNRQQIGISADLRSMTDLSVLSTREETGESTQGRGSSTVQKVGTGYPGTIVPYIVPYNENLSTARQSLNRFVSRTSFGRTISTPMGYCTRTTL